MFGDDDSEPNREVALLLALEFCKLDMPLLLSQKLALLDFESRKDAAQACFDPFPSVYISFGKILSSKNRPNQLCKPVWHTCQSRTLSHWLPINEIGWAYC